MTTEEIIRNGIMTRTALGQVHWIKVDDSQYEAIYNGIEVNLIDNRDSCEVCCQDLAFCDCGHHSEGTVILMLESIDRRRYKQFKDEHYNGNELPVLIELHGIVKEACKTKNKSKVDKRTALERFL